jgi:hypothetical protein
MAIITTLVVPPFLPRLVRRAERRAGADGGAAPMPGIEDDDWVDSA